MNFASDENAICYLSNNNFFKAELILKENISNDFNDYKSLYLLGWIKEKSGKRDDAKRYYLTSKKINSSFFDIDEKISGGNYFLKNKNIDLLNVIKWLLKLEKYDDIEKIIAKTNLNIASSLLNEKITVKYAKQYLYNKEIKDLVKPYSNQLVVEIFDIGMNLNMWGFLHPWQFPVAFSYLIELSDAILNFNSFKKNLLKKKNFNFIEIEIIKKLKIKESLLVLIDMLFQNKLNKENIINAIGVLKNKKAVFPLLNYLKNCNFSEIYQIFLALARIDEKNVIPVLKKYFKKYSNTALKPLLFVCLCRLENGRDGLIKLSNSLDIDIRMEAINQLADFKDNKSIKILLNALFDNTKFNDFYPVRAIAYEKIEEIGYNNLKKINENFGNIMYIKELENIFFKNKPDLIWLEETINRL